ncbi:hypothetical protein HU200_022596 [Digitaria exilis]|uniref:Uncharacterized protein n=1 Tax=Digitaria exilis TaxID=1010633 RepID=A0A835CDN6_9POAL|nr:hypothetical protein HU200_022596 [Digitaria exilis]
MIWIVTTEILSPAMERRLHAQRLQEADHLVRYVYGEISAAKGSSSIRHTYVAQHVIRRLVFGKRHFGESPATLAGGGPGQQEVDHVEALFALNNHLYYFCVSDYFPVLVGLDLDGNEKVAKRVDADGTVSGIGVVESCFPTMQMGQILSADNVSSAS